MTRQSWSRFSAAVLPLHDCQSLPDLGGAILLSMQALLDADIHAVNWLGGVKIRDLSSHTGALIPDALQILNAHLHEHPLMPNINATLKDGKARAGRWTDFTSIKRFQDTGLYHEFFRPLRSTCQIGLTLKINERLSVGLSFNRAGQNYRTEDARALVELGPHIVRAARRVIAMADLERAMVLREIALGKEAVFIVNGEGTVLFGSEQARRLYEDYFAQPVAEVLPAALVARILSGESLVSQVLATGHRGTLRCSTSAEVQWPAHLEARWAGTDYDSRDVRCVRLWEESHAPDLATWERLGLTPRESEVLHWIIQGKRDGEIAEILDTSVRTVQKHVQNILWKLGVETRTAAAAEALRRSAGASA